MTGEVYPSPYDVLLTSLRLLFGLSLGAAWGAALGVIEGGLRSRTLIRVVRDSFRAVPILALVPVVQALSGPSELGKIGIISWAVGFPVWLSVSRHMQERFVDAEYSLQGLGLPSTAIFRAIDVPKGVTGLMAGVELALGVGWISTVAAEWLGTYSAGFWSGGLGYRLMQAYSANSWLGMWECIGAFGLLGVGSSRVWRIGIWLSRRSIPSFDPSYRERHPFG